MKISTPRPAVTFTRDRAEAAALLLYLHSEGLCGVADGSGYPRITVAGCDQAGLNAAVDEFRRRTAAEDAARRRREGRP